MQAFSINKGTSKTVDDGQGNEYVLSVQAFEKHDHEHYPIYYLDYPLSIKSKEKNIGKLVVTVQSTKNDGYPSPYAAAVEEAWTVARRNLTFRFSYRNKKNDESIICQIEQM